MKKLTLLGLALGALFFIPTGAFAHDNDKHHHHHHHYDRSRDYRDGRNYDQTQRDIEADRLANGYHRDGTPRYQNYYYRR